jgi:hypothetical protein
MKRVFLLLATAFVLLGCDSPLFPSPSNSVRSSVVHVLPAAPTSLRHSTRSNKAFARADVRRLVRLVVLPPGGRQVAELPPGSPRRLEDIARTRSIPGIALARRIWIVDAPLQSVVHYVESHVPLRPRPQVPFRAKNASLALKANGSYGFPPVAGSSWSRWLNVDTGLLPGGRTVVVTQAGDGWIHTSPARELLPRGIKRIDLRLLTGERTRHVIVRDRFEVARIVARVNAFGLADAERIACADVFRGGPYLTVRFEGADGRQLARAGVLLFRGESGPCNPVELTIGEKTMPPLIGADVGRLLRQEAALGAGGP